MTFNTTTSRRDFLAGGATVVGGACALSALGAWPLLAAEASAKSKMRFGLATFAWGDHWNVPALIANCHKAGLYGVELRTNVKYPHHVELSLSKEDRAETKKQFADSPVRLVSIACSESVYWPQPEKLKATIEDTKAYLQLSHDVGSEVLRVFPNGFAPGDPHEKAEKAIEGMAQSLKELGAFAANLGQEVSVEAHGPAGELPAMRAVMDRVNLPNVRVRLNCDPRDAEGKGFTENFNLVKDFLSCTIHLHDLNDPQYPYQLMVDLLVKAKWEGCVLVERSDRVPDRVAALAQARQQWEAMIDKATRANARSPA